MNYDNLYLIQLIIIRQYLKITLSIIHLSLVSGKNSQLDILIKFLENSCYQNENDVNNNKAIQKQIKVFMI